MLLGMSTILILKAEKYNVFKSNRAIYRHNVLSITETLRKRFEVSEV